MHYLANKKKIQLRDVDCTALVSVLLSSIRLLITIIFLSSLATEFRAPSGSSNAHYLRSSQEIGEIFLSNIRMLVLQGIKFMKLFLSTTNAPKFTKTRQSWILARMNPMNSVAVRSRIRDLPILMWTRLGGRKTIVLQRFTSIRFRLTLPELPGEFNLVDHWLRAVLHLYYLANSIVKDLLVHMWHLTTPDAKGPMRWLLGRDKKKNPVFKPTPELMIEAHVLTGTALTHSPE